MTKYTYYILGLFFSFLACNSNDNSSINYVEVYYLPKWTNTMFPVQCDMLYGEDWKPELQYHKIDNKTSLQKIERIYKSQNIDTLNGSNLDVRIRCMIHLKSGIIDTLCLGEYFDTVLNNKKVKDSPELFKILWDELDYENSDKRIKDPS